MHSFRIRYIVLGLLVYIQSAYCRTCGSDFDVVSRSLQADVVVEGKVENFSQPGLNRPNVYNATFSVKQILQGVLPKQGKRKKSVKSLIVGDFGRRADKENCIAKVELGKTYILFLQSNDIDRNGLSRTRKRDSSKSRRKRRPSVPFYKISGFPEKSSKKVKRQIRKYGCRNCAKAPKAKLTPKRVNAKLGERVQIRCRTQGGKPTPIVRWFKDGQPLEKSSNIRIKDTKRGSRLRISKAREEDRGFYKCEASNAAGRSTSNETIVVISDSMAASESDQEAMSIISTPSTPSAITTATTRVVTPLSTPRPPNRGQLARSADNYNQIMVAPHRDSFTMIVAYATTISPAPERAVECAEQSICLNGGTCYQLPQLNSTPFCKCKGKYTGRRCQDKDIFTIIHEITNRDAHNLDRTLTITGLVLGALVLAALFIAAHFLAKKRRESFRKRQAERKRLTEKLNSNKGTYKSLPLDGAVTSNPANIEMVALPKVQRMDSYTQTHDNDFPGDSGDYRPAKTRAEDERLIPSPSWRTPEPPPAVVKLPRQNTAPESRLPSGIIEPCRDRLKAVSCTPDFADNRRHPKKNNVAVVNAIVESEPERNSRRSTPSQNSWTESAHSGFGKVPRSLRYTDSASPNTAMDIDQHSDYDNEVSDLEVNRESETDVLGLDISGDEGPSHGPSELSGHGDDTSESESDSTSSSIGEERALFQQLRAKPRLPEMNTPTRNDNSAEKLSWDEFSHTSPLFAVNPHPHYPYSRNDDVIRNRYLSELNPMGSYEHNKDIVEEGLYEYPHDPDPDATVV